MPDAQGRHGVLTHVMNDDVWAHDDQFAGSELATWPASVRKRRQAVSSYDQAAGNTRSSYGVVGCYVRGSPSNVRQRTGTPPNRQHSAGFGSWGIELARREPQEPDPHLFIRYCTRIRVRFGDSCRECAGLGLIGRKRCWTDHTRSLPQSGIRMHRSIAQASQVVADGSAKRSSTGAIFWV